MDLTSSTNQNCDDDTRPSSTFTTSPAPTPISGTTPVSSISHQRVQTPPNGTNKMYSKNANGTVLLTTIPSNEAELQLYRVMQRASLLAYYDTLLEMGGDDVQQLCDAGEEEFLEIMALVGMASKPLHVRRFQKSLQEWMIDPGAFQVPLLPSGSGSGTSVHTIPSTPSETLLNFQNVVCCTRRSILDTNRTAYTSNNNGNSSNNEIQTSNGSINLTANVINTDAASAITCSSPGFSASNKSSSSRSSSPLDAFSSPGSNGANMLSETHIERLKNAAERISKQLPQFEPKTHNAKKKVCKELEVIMSMPISDPLRMDSIRRYAAIYGRFDCKRRPEKPLTLHEVSVNEAAAQLCHFVPALLTRRDELFPLARQVVRDSGTYMYSGMLAMAGNGKNNSSVQWTRRKSNDESSEHDEEPPPKKLATPEKVNTTSA